MTQLKGGEISVPDGVLVGPLRNSVNTARNVKGSIHDDATATRLGLRGGTVAGSIHMDLFPPLLVRAFGTRWFERGSLSLYFTNATTDREAVRAFVTLPAAGAADAQVDVWIERDDGMRVAEGTASVGDPGVPSALQARDIGRYDASDYRILAGIVPGDAMPACDVAYSRAEQGERLAVITEPLDWYEGTSPWGGAVVTPAGMVSLLYARPVAELRGKIGDGVGLFGAIEIRNVNGPAVVDEPYHATGRILARGQSPKTEYFWFDTAIADRAGKPVAEMRMLLRFMKASSPLWAGG